MIADRPLQQLLCHILLSADEGYQAKANRCAVVVITKCSAILQKIGDPLKAPFGFVEIAQL